VAGLGSRTALTRLQAVGPRDGWAAAASSRLEIDPVAEAHVHVVQRGSCWLRTAGEQEHLQLASGDIVLIRGGVGHSICDSLNTTPVPHKQVLEEMPPRLASLPKSRADETTLVFCAKYLFQETGAHPLDTPLSLDEIAPRVGYQTAAAFSRAFLEALAARPDTFARWPGSGPSAAHRECTSCR
jgi:AraC-like DNA-binding protein